MIRTKIWIIAAFAFAALCITACNRNAPQRNVGQDAPCNQYDYSTVKKIPNAVKDIDGNKYDAVKIGDQIWMASNLRTTHYADGTSIPLGTAYSYETPYRYAPGLGQTNEENMANVPVYGYLYNWAAMMHGASSSAANPSGIQGVCPNGWHVPSEAEWMQMITYVGKYVCKGDSTYIAKALATQTGWENWGERDPDIYSCAVGYKQYSNNATSFSAPPSGSYSNYYGGYHGFGAFADFWSSTEDYDYEAWQCELAFYGPFVDRGNNLKDCGFSVRCIKD